MPRPSLVILILAWTISSCGTPDDPLASGEPRPDPYELPLTGRVGVPPEVTTVSDHPLLSVQPGATWQSPVCSTPDGRIVAAVGAPYSAGAVSDTVRVSFLTLSRDGTSTTADRDLDVGVRGSEQSLTAVALLPRDGGYWLLGTLLLPGPESAAAAVRLGPDLLGHGSYVTPRGLDEPPGRAFYDVAERPDGTVLLSGVDPLGAIVVHLDSTLGVLHFDAHRALDDARPPADTWSSHAEDARALSIELDGDAYVLGGLVGNFWQYECGGSCTGSRYYALALRAIPGEPPTWLRDLGPADSFGGSILPIGDRWLLASTAQDDFRFTTLSRDGRPIASRTLGGPDMERLSSARADDDGVLFCGHVGSLPGGDNVLVGRLDGSLALEWALAIHHDGNDGCDALRTSTGEIAVVMSPSRVAWLAP